MNEQSRLSREGIRARAAPSLAEFYLLIHSYRMRAVKLSELRRHSLGVVWSDVVFSFTTFHLRRYNFSVNEIRQLFISS